MNRMFYIFIFIFLTSFCNPVLSQTPAADEEEAIRSTIMKLITSAINKFSDLKGDLISKKEDGSSQFAVKGMESMKSSNQYILADKGGKMHYVAIWQGDTKKILTSFKAFYSLHDGEDYIIEQDKQAATDSKRVYRLKINSLLGWEAAKYVADGKSNTGELTVSGF